MTRDKARAIVEKHSFQMFIITVIVVNAITIGLETVFREGAVAIALEVFDYLCLLIYIGEAYLKIRAWGGDYFKDGWNIFDFAIIVLSIMPPSIIPLPVQVARVVRLFRAARVFRLISVFHQMRIIVEAIGRSLPGVAWTALLLVLLMYVFDVAGVFLFGEQFPEYFGDLGAGMFTLFTVVTLEGWPDVARTIIATYPAAWLYFVPFVILSAFIMVNVVLGIIVSAIEERTQAARIDASESRDAQLSTELAELRAQVETVEYLLAKRAKAAEKEERKPSS